MRLASASTAPGISSTSAVTIESEDMSGALVLASTCVSVHSGRSED